MFKTVTGKRFQLFPGKNDVISVNNQKLCFLSVYISGWDLVLFYFRQFIFRPFYRTELPKHYIFKFFFRYLCDLFALLFFGFLHFGERVWNMHVFIYLIPFNSESGTVFTEDGIRCIVCVPFRVVTDAGNYFLCVMAPVISGKLKKKFSISTCISCNGILIAVHSADRRFSAQYIIASLLFRFSEASVHHTYVVHRPAKCIAGNLKYKSIVRLKKYRTCMHQSASQRTHCSFSEISA